MVQQMLSWQILRQCQPVSTAVCSRMNALITIGSSARFMLSGCRNVPDHPFFLLHTSRYQNIVLGQYWHTLSSKRTWVGRQDLQVKRLGWGLHLLLFPLAWRESFTFQIIIYQKTNKKPNIMHTSKPFYNDINKLITVVTHCLDI